MSEHTYEPFGLCFERQVEHAPDRIAIATPERRLTYAETAEQARKISRRVQAATREEQALPVALMMEHGPDAVVAVVGILSAARGYTPLDPHMPPGRLAKMLELSGANRIMTDRAHADLARDLAGDGMEVLVFEAITAEPAAPFANSQVDEETLGALLFTSGTTGEPKGVPISHRSLMRNVRAIMKVASISADDRCSLITALSYMPSTYCMLGPLMAGGSTHPFNIREHGIDGVLPWLKASGLTVLLTVPTIFRKVTAQLANNADVGTVRHVHLAGEPLLAADVERFRAHFGPSAGLFNEIGSTETGTFAGLFIDHSTELEGGVVPTGYAYDDVEVLLKKEDGTDAATGEMGELYVRGPFVARGYWHRPDLSEGRFFQDPHNPNVWTYRTGDLATRREDGCIVAMGRKDDQVKINGVRVEPAEVQAVLSSLPGVREAFVVAPMNDEGERRLVAYVSGDAGTSLTAGDLRAAAAERLSIAMTPSAFVVLDALPTTESGKVDRKALPDPDSVAPTRAAPTGGGESSGDVFTSGLAVAFERTLNLNGVGPNDDFFLIGGDSLKAVELMGLIEENFNVKLPVSIMLEATTPAQIAERITAHVRSDAPHGVLRLSGWNAAPGAMTPIFCVPGAGGHVLCYRHLINALEVENPIYGLEYPGLTGGEEPLTSIDAIADYFASCIQETAPTGPVALIGHSVGGSVVLEVGRRLNAAGRETPIVAFLDALAPSAMRDMNIAEKTKLVISYLFDTTQPDKVATIMKRGSHFLRKSADKLMGRATPEPDWGHDDPDGILSAVRDEHIRKVVAACQQAAIHYAPEPQKQSVVQFRSTGPVSPMMTQVDSYSEWNTVTCGGVREIEVPGSHNEVLQPPAVDVVAANIREMLQASAAGTQAAE